MNAYTTARLLLPHLVAIACPFVPCVSAQGIVAQDAYLKTSNAGIGDRFGNSCAVFGDTVLIGAVNEGSNATGVNGDQLNEFAGLSGAAYVFVGNSGSWSQQAYLKASNTGPGDDFGYATAIFEDTVVVGAPLEDSQATNSGAAYVFLRSGTTWSHQAMLKADQPMQSSNFGDSVAISGDTIVVGASGGLVPGAATGGAFVFIRTGTTWTQQASLSGSNTEPDDAFGDSVGISGDTIIVGARFEDGATSGVGGNGANNNAPDSGAAYIFVRNGTTWSEQAYLKASNTWQFDWFGFATSISGDTVVVSARSEDSSATGINGDQSDDGATNSGAAYVFVRTGTNWEQQAYLKASNTDFADAFGYSLFLDGDRIVIGARDEDSISTGVNADQTNNGGFRPGAAYLFERVATTWSQTAYLKASTIYDRDRFGSGVGISGDLVCVGAETEPSSGVGVNGDPTNPTAIYSGAAYLFDLDFDPFGTNIGTDFCSGDGGNQLGCTNCPCMNNAPAGTVGGCLNSTASSGRLRAFGSSSVSVPIGAGTDLRFSLEDSPPTAFAVLVSGDGLAPGNAANPCFGQDSGIQVPHSDGLLCARANIRRHGVRFVNQNGDVGLTSSPWGGEAPPTLGLARVAGFVSGQTRYFQVRHRDDLLLSCMRGQNSSQAVEITFAP